MTDIDLELGPVCEAVLTASARITPANTDEVRHLVLHISDPAFRYVEGQSIGVVVPGPHAFGNKFHMRRYSVANARQAAAEEGLDIELLVRRCFYVDEVSGERYPGVASSFLCDMKPGDRVSITGPYRSPFKMPADDSANLVMIGTGTGIAPFRAFMQHIYRQRGGWRGKVRLFYGARTGMDMLYMNDENADIANYYDQATFRAFSGVAPRVHLGEDEGLARTLADNVNEVWDLLQEPNTHVFVAGLSKIAHALDRVMAAKAGSPERWQEMKRALVAGDRWSELIYS
jgi:ferredoxin--NADP+ reductase